MSKQRGKHKQSKRFTILLIPDSPAKIRSLRTPYWVLCAPGFPLILIILLVIIFQTRIFDLENRLNNTPLQTAEAEIVEEKVIIEEESAADIGVSHEVGQSEDLTVDTRIEEFEQKLAQLIAKSDLIDSYKQDIFLIFEELEALNLPFTFDLEESVLTDGTIALGGAYPDGTESILSELDGVLTNEIDEMQVIVTFVEFLGSYFKDRPTGWPVDGRQIDSEFGYRASPFTGEGYERHDGVDIDAPYGANVYATADGVVSTAGWNDGGYGYLVVIEHGYRYSTYYGHNSSVLVSVGDEVVRGQVIALVGSTGRSTAPHCHYEVRRNGIPQNPREFLY